MSGITIVGTLNEDYTNSEYDPILIDTSTELVDRIEDAFKGLEVDDKMPSKAMAALRFQNDFGVVKQSAKGYEETSGRVTDTNVQWLGGPLGWV